MPTETLKCPACNAADTSREDAAGYHQCLYCGVRYRIRGGVATRADAPAGAVADAGPGRFFVVGVVVAILGAVWVVLSTMGEGPPIPPRAGGSGSETPVRGSARPAQEVPAPPAPVEVAAPAPPEPEPEVPATATFEFHSRRPSSGTTFYAIGWATNTSPFVIDRPKITAVLLDDKGVEVGTDSGYAEGDALAPGARAPVKLIVSDPPPFASMQFEVTARRASYIPGQVEGLRIEQSPAKADMFGTKIAGKVHNEGSVPAEFVRITALGFDADDKLVGVDYTYVDDEILQPGKSSRFEVSMFETERPAVKYELTATGRPAD